MMNTAWSLEMECRGHTIVFCKLVQIGIIGLQLLWHILHFFVTICYLVMGIASVVNSYLISSGLRDKYKALDLTKLRYLAIVVESEEACHTSKVCELLQWLKAIGLKQVCLYDAEGVLKKSRKAIIDQLKSAKILEEANGNDKLIDQHSMTLEFSSFSDGKEAVAKAASILLEKYMKLAKLGEDQAEHIFTESNLIEAFKSIGCNGPEPDLLLVYGPVRCHLGFPSWRIKYTEIIHMGSLKSMRYGSLFKAMYKSTMVNQNFGK